MVGQICSISIQHQLGDLGNNVISPVSSPSGAGKFEFLSIWDLKNHVRMVGQICSISIQRPCDMS